MAFKGLIVCLAFFICSYSIGISHRSDINVDKLTDDQKQVRDYIASKVDRFKGATLTSGQQNGIYYTFRFVGGEQPKTYMDAYVVKNSKNQYNLVKVVTSSTVGNLKGGSSVTTKKAFTKSQGTFTDALKVSGFALDTV